LTLNVFHEIIVGQVLFGKGLREMLNFVNIVKKGDFNR